jgi:tetratricopeptide (TPR) repeat protein
MVGLLSVWRDWTERREILRDIRRQRADNAERNRFRARDLLEEALAAIELDDHTKGSAIWTSALERYPEEVRMSPLTLTVLLKLHRYDEAEALMQEGRKRHPGDLLFANGLAVVAQTRGDHDAAVERYATVRKQFPGMPQGYVLGAQSLAVKGRFNEADVLVEKAMGLFPREIGGFLEYARLAAHREDWAESMRRWTIVEETFSDRIFGPLGRAQALIKLGRYDEADEVIGAARFRFPTDSALLAESARCAQTRGDIPEAVKRWKRRIERAPMEAYGYFEAARALESMGEQIEAEAILQAAADRFPS